MIIQKKIKVIILSVVLSVMLNVGYFKTLNHESYLNIIGKAVSINYLSFEPIIQRGRLVKNFDIQCKKTDCLPLVKNKNSGSLPKPCNRPLEPIFATSAIKKECAF